MFAVKHKNGTFFAGFSGAESIWTDCIEKAEAMPLQEAKIQAALFLSSRVNIPVQRKPVPINA